MHHHIPLQFHRTWCVCFIILFLPGALHAQNKKARVLFIGNSYTYVNDLPKMVADMAASAGDTLQYDVSVAGGVSFYNHIDPRITTLHTLKKLRAGGWDYVVLQEQSTGFSLESFRYYGGTFTDARRMIDTVKRYNPCAEIIFYMTWGRKNGLPNSCNYPPWPYQCTYLAMDSVIRARTIELAFFTKTTISPVSAVWRYMRNNYPAIELYDPDESHPAPAGSYAGACSFYTAIFKKNAEVIRYNFSLPVQVAANIRAVAAKVVYDSLKFWRIGKNETIAGFEHHAQGMQVTSFTNRSVNASQYKWDFGDGQNSTAVSPAHTWLVPGIYTVRLIATGTSCSDTAYARVSTTNDPQEGMFAIGPNPVRDKLYITSNLFEQDSYRLLLLNSRGQPVLQQRASPAVTQSINLTGLASGMYTLSICTTKRIYRKKIIVLP